jgi:hypothetical protein
MHVVHTAGEPPKSGRIILATIGWTENRRKAPRQSVRAKRDLATDETRKKRIDQQITQTAAAMAHAFSEQAAPAAGVKNPLFKKITGFESIS